MEEYQQYRESEAWQRDAAFWAEQRRQLPLPASLSPAPLPGRSASAGYSAPETGIYRRGIPPVGYATFRCAAYRFSPSLAALWLGRLCNRMDYAAGFIFMRRPGLGGADLLPDPCSTFCRWVFILRRKTLPELATRLAAQLKKMRRHQRYDAEQIVRDSGQSGR